MLGSTNSIYGQQLHFFNQAQTNGDGIFEVSIGYNYYRFSSEFGSGKVDDIIGVGFSRGFGDNFELKIGYQRLNTSEVSVFAAAPKIGFGSLAVIPTILYSSVQGNSDIQLNPTVIYDFEISEDTYTSIGANYLASTEDFGEGLFGLFVGSAKQFGTLKIKAYYHFSTKDSIIYHGLGFNLGMQFGSSSSSSGKKSKDNWF